MKLHPIGLVLCLCTCLATIKAARAATQTTESLQSALLTQGVPQEAITGVDRRGVPVLCGTRPNSPSPAQIKIPGGNSPLPPATRSSVGGPQRWNRQLSFGRTTTPASDGRYELLENTAGSGGFFYRLRW